MADGFDERMARLEHRMDLGHQCVGLGRRGVGHARGRRGDGRPVILLTARRDVERFPVGIHDNFDREPGEQALSWIAQS